MKKHYSQLQDFYIGALSTIPAPYKIVLFNALSCQVYSHYDRPGYFNQPGFLSAQRPQLSTEGILATAASGNVNGNIGWFTAPGATAGLLGTSNDGLTSFVINGGANGYNNLLEYIKTQAIKVKRVKLSCSDVTQFSQDWTIVRRYPDGKTTEEILTVSNKKTPDQVNNFTVEFDVDILIDKYTGIEITLTALNVNGLNIQMWYEEI